MSEPNEPPKKIESWTINIKWNDGDKEELVDIPNEIAQGIDDWLSEVEYAINDHIKGKYGQEVEQAEDLHAQNSKRFVDYEKKSD